MTLDNVSQVRVNMSTETGPKCSVFERKVEMILPRAHVWWPIFTCTGKTICTIVKSKVMTNGGECHEVIICHKLPGLNEVISSFSMDISLANLLYIEYSKHF